MTKYITKEEFEKVDEQYGVVVLDDSETYSSALDVIAVFYLTEEGWEELDEGAKFKHLMRDEDKIAMTFSVRELIEFWKEFNPH